MKTAGLSVDLGNFDMDIKDVSTFMMSPECVYLPNGSAWQCPSSHGLLQSQCTVRFRLGFH